MLIKKLKHLLEYPIDSVNSLKKPGVRHKYCQMINRFYHSRGGRRRYNPNGIDIFEEDWDTLIILDACRYDSFKKEFNRSALSGTLQKRTSRGSRTPEWLFGNFANSEHYDTVYISAGAMPYHVGVVGSNGDSPHQREYGFELKVHKLINVWKDPPEGALPAPNDNLKDSIIPPDVIANEAIKISQRYPHKRLIIHIMQPHDPYLGPTGQEIHQMSSQPWYDKLSGERNIPTEKLRQAYIENLKMAIEASETIVNNIEGKTVISADHGEYLWERSYPVPIIEFKHPNKIYDEELVRVPWFISEGERKDIRAEEPQGVVDDKSDHAVDANEQLKALGYKF